MARPLRIEYPGAFYHITTRGVGRQDIFFDEADKRMFLEKSGEALEKWGLVVHGYCLMSNHYHLEVETPEGNISKSKRDYGRTFIYQLSNLPLMYPSGFIHIFSWLSH